MSKRMDYLDGMWVFIGFVFGVGLFGCFPGLQRKVVCFHRSWFLVGGGLGALLWCVM